MAFPANLKAQTPIEGGEITGIVKGKAKPIALRSSNPNWLAMAERLFSTHGGYALVEGGQPSFTFVFEPAGKDLCRLVILSGRPAKELFTGTTTGNSDREALYGACDLAVQKTLGIPGYFSGKLAVVSDRTDSREIWTSDLLFLNARQLTTHRSNSINPDWSPDGSKLLYTSYYRTGFPDIIMLDLNRMRASVFASYKGTNTGGAFSPDGREVAMILSPSGNSDLFVGPASGGKPQRLTRTGGVEASPAWSPDGRRIVYTSDEPGGPQLFIMPATGGRPQYLNTRLSRYIDEPDWNPLDPSKILFTAAAGGGYQIGIIDLNTKKANWLTRAGNNSEACWLNDGRHIIYVQKRGKWHSLRILDSETGKDSALSPSRFGNATQPAFVYPK